MLGFGVRGIMNIFLDTLNTAWVLIFVKKNDHENAGGPVRPKPGKLEAAGSFTYPKLNRNIRSTPEAHNEGAASAHLPETVAFQATSECLANHRPLSFVVDKGPT